MTSSVRSEEGLKGVVFELGLSDGGSNERYREM